MRDLNTAYLLLPEINELLQGENFAELKTIVSSLNPIDFADILSRFGPDHRVLLLRLLPPRQLLTVFQELDQQEQRHFLDHVQQQMPLSAVQGTPMTSADVFDPLPSSYVKRMTTYMRRGHLEHRAVAPNFPPDSIASLMRTDFVPLEIGMTVRQALERLRACLRVRHGATISDLFVIDREHRLVGAVPVQTLIAAPQEMNIRDLMESASAIKVPITMDREEAAKSFAPTDSLILPVVDEDNHLVGVLPADEVIKVVQQEATEDIHKLGALETLDEPYFKISFRRMFKKRVSWLCALFLGEMLTATAMSFFEAEIAKAVVLALFIPLIISSGGNSGSQAATLIVRAMALKEVTFSDWFRVIRRELAAGLALGAVLGTIGFLRIFLWSQVSPIYGPHYTLIAATVGLSLVAVVLWGTLAGSTLPLLLRRLGLDPAVASVPLVATLVDVTGLVIYFMTGVAVLRGTLL